MKTFETIITSKDVAGNIFNCYDCIGARVLKRLTSNEVPENSLFSWCTDSGGPINGDGRLKYYQSFNEDDNPCNMMFMSVGQKVTYKECPLTS